MRNNIRVEAQDTSINARNILEMSDFARHGKNEDSSTINLFGDDMMLIDDSDTFIDGFNGHKPPIHQSASSSVI